MMTLCISQSSSLKKLGIALSQLIFSLRKLAARGSVVDKNISMELLFSFCRFIRLQMNIITFYQALSSPAPLFIRLSGSQSAKVGYPGQGRLIPASVTIAGHICSFLGQNEPTSGPSSRYLGPLVMKKGLDHQNQNYRSSLGADPLLIEFPYQKEVKT